MGPDPVLGDWKLHTSAKDTVKYSPSLRGFYLDTLDKAEISKFPLFTAEELLRAYRRRYKEYGRNRNGAATLIELADVELHRVILEVLDENSQLVTVVVFTYAHFG
jgi:hypothetical protein